MGTEFQPCEIFTSTVIDKGSETVDYGHLTVWYARRYIFPLVIVNAFFSSSLIYGG